MAKKNEAVKAEPGIRKKFISVNKASLHNLKDVSVDIPHNKLTVISGVSGSGKSSLAFDTIYAEGQRRFVESLSAYARQFLERMHKPEVESITGLPPAVAIEQRKQSKNPRSTVGTTTEIYDYLRLLYGRIGATICRNCEKPVQKDSPNSIVNEILKLEEDTKLYILAPINPQARTIESELPRFREYGFFRYSVPDSDVIHDFDDKEGYENLTVNDFYVLIDRMVLAKDAESVTRLTDSIELAFKVADGRIKIKNLTNRTMLNFSNRFECSDCDIVYEEPEPRLFSFNNPFGACPSCQGFGRTIGIDEDLIIPDKTKSLQKLAVHPFRTTRFNENQIAMIKEGTKAGVRLDVPYSRLTEKEIEFVWEGRDSYPGINGYIKMLEENNYKMHYRVMLSRYRGYTKCRLCGGSRLRTSARQAFVCGKSIPDLVKMPISELLKFSRNLELNEHQLSVVSQVVNEIQWRIQLLVDIGLHYLTLDRLSHTLSGGEAQRINLSTALGSSLVGTLYVLDEPSIGLHPRDTDRLISILYKLRNLGNTIIVVEHDPDIIRQADYLIDMGPKAGENGGEIVFAGTIEEMKKSKQSITAQYMTGKKSIPLPAKRSAGNNHFLEIIAPRENNLKMDQVRFPLGCIVCVTGVSGSGKSTLIHDVLYDGLKKSLVGGKESSASFEKISGTLWLDNVEMVDQSSIGKSTRSTPITYTKVFDHIRDLYASTQAAKQLGWKPGHFSFNVTGGRCEVCEGEGTVTVDMQFLPDVQLICESCKGTRYKKDARSILYKGKSIVDVLNMTIDEALVFFTESNKITNKLKLLSDVGLGYLRLGQPSTMLSGGESQRIKLANHLDASYNTNLLFIFDEPTTGLHLDDINKLIKCFRRLIEGGHSVIIIEHNLNVIASADWIIDLGPEAGEEGGLIVAEGTPEDVAKVKQSFTGKALKEFLQERKTNSSLKD
jgi:excinuclease ABC subunit A